MGNGVKPGKVNPLVGNRIKQNWMVLNQQEIDELSDNDWAWYEQGECICDDARTYHQCRCGAM